MSTRTEVLVISQAAAAQIRWAAMVAENQCRLAEGEQIAYGEEVFLALIEEYSLDWNTVIGYLNQDT